MTIITMMIMNLLSDIKAVKNTQIKKGLIPIAWHPSRWWNWGNGEMSEDSKRDAEALWVET